MLKENTNDLFKKTVNDASRITYEKATEENEWVIVYSKVMSKIFEEAVNGNKSVKIHVSKLNKHIGLLIENELLTKGFNVVYDDDALFITW